MKTLNLNEVQKGDRILWTTIDENGDPLEEYNANIPAKFAPETLADILLSDPDAVGFLALDGTPGAVTLAWRSVA